MRTQECSKIPANSDPGENRLSQLVEGASQTGEGYGVSDMWVSRECVNQY